MLFTTLKTSLDDKMLVEKLDVVEGKITSTKNTGKDDYSVKIDGTWTQQAITPPTAALIRRSR